MIIVNMDKAKEIAHNIRRSVREKEFEPFDSIIMKQIPGANTDEAESKRQEIRDRYVVIQSDIDSTSNIDDLTLIVKQLNEE